MKYTNYIQKYSFFINNFLCYIFSLKNLSKIHLFITDNAFRWSTNAEMFVVHFPLTRILRLFDLRLISIYLDVHERHQVNMP